MLPPPCTELNRSCQDNGLQGPASRFLSWDLVIQTCRGKKTTKTLIVETQRAAISSSMSHLGQSGALSYRNLPVRTGKAPRSPTPIPEPLTPYVGRLHGGGGQVPII